VEAGKGRKPGSGIAGFRLPQIITPAQEGVLEKLERPGFPLSLE
jgi:hypothetical protein